jgi:nucleoid-associated protein YgaU
VVVSAYPATPSGSDNVLTGVTTRGAREKSQISDLRSQIAKTAPVAASPSSGGRTITYTVKKGDSLWKICKAQLGDGNLMNRVARDNNIADPSRLKPGTQLKLTVPDRGVVARPA